MAATEFESDEKMRARVTGLTMEVGEYYAHDTRSTSVWFCEKPSGDGFTCYEVDRPNDKRFFWANGISPNLGRFSWLYVRVEKPPEIDKSKFPPFSEPPGSFELVLKWLDCDRYIYSSNAATAFRLFLQEHREELRRWFLEQAARQAAGATERNPVIVDKGNAAPYLFESQCLAVAVGEDWRPKE